MKMPRLHHPSSTPGDYGLLPPSKETPSNRYTLWILLASSSSNSVIGIGVIILLIAGVALGCYVYRLGKTFSLETGTIKKITDKPSFRLSPPVFQDTQAHSNLLRLHVRHDNRGL